MLCTARSRVALAGLAILIGLAAIPVTAADGGGVRRTDAPSAIVIGFVGGFVRHDNPHHGPVRLARQLENGSPSDAYIRVFENRRRKQAYQTILRLIDRDHNGVLSEEEKAQARIILYGHSWGGSAVVLLARELNRRGIPVLLTVQVDSVAKLWQWDSVIPDNVSAAANFYQPHGVVRGIAEITAADPGRTQILGNFRFDYRKEPVHCEGLSWFDRFVTPSHAQSECDPRLWSEVEGLVRQRLEAGVNALAGKSEAVEATSPSYH